MRWIYEIHGVEPIKHADGCVFFFKEEEGKRVLERPGGRGGVNKERGGGVAEITPRAGRCGS